MVSVTNGLESDVSSEAKCLVRKFNNPHDKSTNNDTLECCVDKNKTVREFINMVAQYYNLEVDSFFLTLSSFKSDSTSETIINNKVIIIKLIMYFFKNNDLSLIFQPKLEADDDRQLIEVGVVFGEGTQNRFVLSENDEEHDQVEESDQAECVVRIPKDMKVYPLTVDQNETAGQLYKRVLELCQAENFNTDFFVLTFNSYLIDATAELVKVC